AIADRGIQNVTFRDGSTQTTSLAQAFKAKTPRTAAIRSRYRTAGKLRAGVRSFLAKSDTTGSQLFFIGAPPEVWSELAKKAAKPGPEDEALREVQKLYVGDSWATREVCRRTALFAGSDDPVLICGPPGSGKGIAAIAVHVRSRRRGGPFLPLN